jgi:iron-binding CDGSH zinc finger protein/divergent 4Fe-4S mono-cluster protein
LPEVFDPKKRSWVNIYGTSTDRIIAQVKECPSGALSYYMNSEENKEAASQVKARVEVLANGPLLIYGTLRVKDKHGNESVNSKMTAFCRCGASKNKPYCDGSHIKTGFKDE